MITNLCYHHIQVWWIGFVTFPHFRNFIVGNGGETNTTIMEQMYVIIKSL